MTNSIDPSKYVGKKKGDCPKCNGSLYYVNPMGGVSCLECYPPRKSEHLVFRLISDGGFLQVEGHEFSVQNRGCSGRSFEQQKPNDDENRKNAFERLTSPPKTGDIINGRVVVRRKSSEPLTDPELRWIVCPGGILDQMAAGIVFSRPGETIDEIQVRRAGKHGLTSRRKKSVSNVGSVAAVTSRDIRFVADSSTIPPRFEIFPAGTPCLSFSPRNVPPDDPEADDVKASIAGRPRNAPRVAVIRLGGMLRIVDETAVKVG